MLTVIGVPSDTDIRHTGTDTVDSSHHGFAASGRVSMFLEYRGLKTDS